jgi:membrane associated rhomboid family serine protease
VALNASEDTRKGLVAVGAAAALMWAVEVVDVVAGGRLDALGIEPRQVDGLTGLVAAPFLHDGFAHLIGNTIPFLVLGALIALAGLGRVLAVTAIVAVVGGFGTWLFGPAGTVHVGASGVVFGYAAYLVARGVFTRRAVEIGVGLVVLVIWGTTLLRGLVPADGISWQGHLFGALAGVVAARMLQRRRPAAD